MPTAAPGRVAVGLMLYAGNNLDKARGIFERTREHRHASGRRYASACGSSTSGRGTKRSSDTEPRSPAHSPLNRRAAGAVAQLTGVITVGPHLRRPLAFPSAIPLTLAAKMHRRLLQHSRNCELFRGSSFAGLQIAERAESLHGDGCQSSLR